MSIIPVSSLDWPLQENELETVSIQCAGQGFLDYQSRRLQHRGFRHGSSFLEYESSDSNDEDQDNDNDVVSSSTRDLLKMQHAELEHLTYYQVLGDIPMHSTKEQVKRAYHRACLKYHPDKTGRGEEDEVFLKVKAAFDTLSHVQKRKAYDSTIDFDDSIPKGGETPNEFYSVYGPVFERNLRFDASNDPTSTKTRNKKRNSISKNKPPLLGNDETPIEQVHAFYEYWIHFESWRDFTLAATQQTEGNQLDVDNAESRYEKRWIQKEIDKKAKSLKREEMARINTLVERSMAADPRLKREKLRIQQEKERAAAEKKRQQEELEKQQLQEAARLAAERAKQEEEEQRKKAEAKANKEKEKKQLRKARQTLRKAAMEAFSNKNGDTLYNSLHDMNDHVELLCTELSAVQITKLTHSMNDDGSKALSRIHNAATDTKTQLQKETELEEQRRDEARKESAKKVQQAKAQKASNPWTKEELSALAKGVKKYPAGGANRWETIALFVNNLCKPPTPRTKEECIEKYNLITTNPKAFNKASSSVSNAASKTAPLTTWTDEQDKQLQEGLANYPASMDKNERWTMIAKGVNGKSKKECVQRFKAIREAIKKK